MDEHVNFQGWICPLDIQIYNELRLVWACCFSIVEVATRLHCVWDLALPVGADSSIGEEWMWHRQQVLPCFSTVVSTRPCMASSRQDQLGSDSCSDEQYSLQHKSPGVITTPFDSDKPQARYGRKTPPPVLPWGACFMDVSHDWYADITVHILLHGYYLWRVICLLDLTHMSFFCTLLL